MMDRVQWTVATKSPKMKIRLGGRSLLCFCFISQTDPNEPEIFFSCVQYSSLIAIPIDTLSHSLSNILSPFLMCGCVQSLEQMLLTNTPYITANNHPVAPTSDQLQN